KEHNSGERPWKDLRPRSEIGNDLPAVGADPNNSNNYSEKQRKKRERSSFLGAEHQGGSDRAKQDLASFTGARKAHTAESQPKSKKPQQHLVDKVTRQVNHSRGDRGQAGRGERPDRAKPIPQCKHNTDHADAKKYRYHSNRDSAGSLITEQQVVNAAADQREIVQSRSVIIGGVVAVNSFPKQAQKEESVYGFVVVQGLQTKFVYTQQDSQRQDDRGRYPPPSLPVGFPANKFPVCTNFNFHEVGAPRFDDWLCSFQPG